MSKSRYRWGLVVGLAAWPWLAMLIFSLSNFQPPVWIMMYYLPIAHGFCGLLDWWNWKCAGIYVGVAFAPFFCSGADAETVEIVVLILFAVVAAWCVARGLRALHLRGYV